MFILISLFAGLLKKYMFENLDLERLKNHKNKTKKIFAYNF